jgi:glucose/arabinose dehydrogenase
LLGVAVDPAWPARPYLYFHSTHTDTTIHITMCGVTGDLTNPFSTNLVLGNPYLLLKCLDQYEHHNGGTVRFGPDGLLYASFGDDGWTCRVQNVNLLNGKILRLDVSQMPGAGSGPPPKADITPAGNPFFGTGDDARLVYARGLRNPFRFTIDPLTNDVYLGDVGDLTWEEVDHIASSGYTGSNFGWPELEGFMPNPCCPTCVSEPPYVDPIYVYPNPADPISAAITCGPLYRRVLGSPASFGAEYDGSLFIADSATRWIRRLIRTANGWEVAPPVPGQPSALDWAVNLGGIVDLQGGPDGGLYFIPWPGGILARGVWRIVPTTAVDVASEGARIATARAVPNPATLSGGVTIEYRLPSDGPADLHVFDVAGRLLRILPIRDAASGTLHWDGRLPNGQPAAPGNYFYRVVTTTGQTVRGRMSLIR